MNHKSSALLEVLACLAVLALALWFFHDAIQFNRP
jgi:hypothetical protein